MLLLDDLVNNEKIIYKCEKGRIRVFFDVIFLLIGLICFMIGFNDVKKFFLHNDIIFQMQGRYYMMFSGIFLIAIVINNLTSYFLNMFAITENFIIIKNGILGKHYLIRKSDLVAKRQMIGHSRTSWLVGIYKIEFLLSSGRTIKTGKLHCTSTVFQETYDKLIYPSVDNKTEFAEFETSLTNISNLSDIILIKSNYFVPAINFIWYVLLVFLIMGLVWGVNEKCGIQDKFTINGIDNTYVSSYKGSPVYQIIVYDNENKKWYEIDVKKDVYDTILPNQKIKVTGKIGCVGITYDLRLFNTN